MIHQKLFKMALGAGRWLGLGSCLLGFGTHAGADWPIRISKLQDLDVRQEASGTWKFKNWSSRQFFTQIEKTGEDRWELQVCKLDPREGDGACVRGDWDLFNGTYTYEPNLSGLCKREPQVDSSSERIGGCRVLLTTHRFVEVDRDGITLQEGPVQLEYNLDPHRRAIPGTGPHTGILERLLR